MTKRGSNRLRAQPAASRFKIVVIKRGSNRLRAPPAASRFKIAAIKRGSNRQAALPPPSTNIANRVAIRLDLRQIGCKTPFRTKKEIESLPDSISMRPNASAGTACQEGLEVGGEVLGF